MIAHVLDVLGILSAGWLLGMITAFLIGASYGRKQQARRLAAHAQAEAVARQKELYSEPWVPS